MRWIAKALCGATAIVMVLPGLLLATPPPTFGQVNIRRVTSPPPLEDFLQMKPSPTWEGKLAKVKHFIQRTPSDGEPTTHRTEAYLILGRVVEAREQAEGAVALARSHQQRGWEAWGLKLLGDIHVHEPADVDQGGVEQAGAAYRQALALATELGMQPLVAHCHFGLGKLHARTGQREEARQHLATATTLYREMDMRFWLEQAETAAGY